MIAGESLLIFAIYDGTLSGVPYPFAVQAWVVKADGTYSGGPAMTARTLDEARSRVPPGLYRLDRADDDHPAVIESWL